MSSSSEAAPRAVTLSVAGEDIKMLCDQVGFNSVLIQPCQWQLHQHELESATLVFLDEVPVDDETRHFVLAVEALLSLGTEGPHVVVNENTWDNHFDEKAKCHTRLHCIHHGQLLRPFLEQLRHARRCTAPRVRNSTINH